MLRHPPCSIELRRLAAGRAGPNSAPGRDRPTVLRDDAPLEVRAFEVHAPDGLVHRPQLGQGERRSYECRCDAREVEIDADGLSRYATRLSFVRMHPGICESSQALFTIPFDPPLDGAGSDIVGTC